MTIKTGKEETNRHSWEGRKLVTVPLSFPLHFSLWGHQGRLLFEVQGNTIQVLRPSRENTPVCEVAEQREFETERSYLYFCCGFSDTQVKQNCDFSHRYDFLLLLMKSALLGFCLFLNSEAIFTLLTLSFEPKHWPYLFSIYNLLCLFYELLRKTQDGREELYHKKRIIS